ncbi:MAG: hypothetical protein AABW87_01855 [Nanoarchaeota archaeon]
MKKVILLLALIFLAACSSVNTGPTGSTVDDSGSGDSGGSEPTLNELESTDCKTVIATLEKELNSLREEKEELEGELAKEIRRKDQSDAQKIDEMSVRIRMIRKGLIPTLEASIQTKKAACPQ